MKYATKCYNCDTPIKYVYTHNGKPYGSTCIQYASGINPKRYVWKDGQPHEKETRLRMERIALNNKIREQQLEKEKEIKEKNIEIYSDLVALLERKSKHWSDFCASIANDILKNSKTNVLSEMMSSKAYEVVKEIWAKETGGRKNSKAYKEALVKFDVLFK